MVGVFACEFHVSAVFCQQVLMMSVKNLGRRQLGHFPRGQDSFIRHQHLISHNPSSPFTSYLQLHEIQPRGEQRARKGFSWQKVEWELPSLQRKETKTLARGLIPQNNSGLRSDIQKYSSRPSTV